MIGMRLGLAAIAVVASTMVSEGHSGSLEDQIACTPDVYRLCAAQMPDEGAIVACLTRNKPSLSAGCAKVFARPAPGTQGQAPANDDDDN